MIPNDASKLKGLHLFCNPYSNCAGRVMLAVAEKELDVQIHIVDLLKAEQLSQEYYAINPTCDVPAIVHDGKTMGDSVAILRYLEEKFTDKPLTPTASEQKLEMDALLDSASKSHMEYIVPWIYAKGLGRLPTPEQKAFYDKYVPHRSHFHNERIASHIGTDYRVPEKKINHALSDLNQKLSQHKYLVDDKYSLADIAWFPTLYLLGKTFAFPLKKYPHILRWMHEIENSPAFVKGVKSYMSPIPNCLLRVIIRLIRLTGGRK